ncbi:hypothetical protein SLS53_001577 [Cytospora paraplurivora]|uniref:DUF7820 domain-containing protein n=1 Tax=Cytospora paraplurivora TaxID=2898453 RepID=A0AAN9UFG4_9PEZI
MYSQNTRLARTMSVATTSSTPTTRPESEYNGPRGPAHPYSMYPQNPFTDTSSAVDAPTVPIIPVGFVNNTDPYQRRLGPEGEEVADIIGPDGHTEELPPYTRYPDEYYNRKIRDNQQAQPEGSAVAAGAVAAASIGASPATAVHTATVPAAAVPATVDSVVPTAAVAIEDPPVTTARAIPGAGGIGLAARDPEYDAASDTRSPQSRNSTRTSTNESHHEVNTAAAPLSEKPQLNRLQRFAKRKACGVIPYWAICLTVTAILVVMIIVGAVVGTLLSRHHKDPHDQEPAPSTLPLNLDKSPNTCFNNTAQTSAWSCQLIFEEATQMQMSISRNTPQLGDEGNYDILLIVNSTLSGSYNPLSYGAQPPRIEPAIGLELVNDTFDLDRGPAWFRMLPYNKTVLVPEDLLSVTSSSKVRRNGGGFPPKIGDLQRKGAAAQTGDKPWLCTWPGTVVEVFIYAEQNSSYASQTIASTGVITSAPTATPTATSTSSGSDSIQTTTTDVSAYMPLASYPRAVKVKERRTPQSSSPYCVQVTVNDDNTSTTPVLNSEGQPVTIYIVENESESVGATSSQSTSKARRHSRGIEDSKQRLYRRDDDGDMSACGCMWFSS